MHSRVYPFALLAAFVLLCVPLQAALPLTAIRKMQEASPEKVKIEITEVTKRERKDIPLFLFEMTVKAKVVAVTASASGLAVGDELEIHYMFPNLGKVRLAGDWPGEVHNGSTYNAFLKVKDAAKKTYDPAASSGSFERVEVKQP